VRWAGTHSYPQHAPYRGLDGGDAALSCRADLLGGEGPLDRTQPHREGERLPALPDLLAGEDVEEEDALGEIAHADHDRRLDRGGGDHGGRRVDQRLEVELEGAGARRHVELLDDRRMQLAGVADHGAGAVGREGPQLPGTAGVEGRLLDLTHLELRTDGGGRA